jgi:hypothetical protein
MTEVQIDCSGVPLELRKTVPWSMGQDKKPKIIRSHKIPIGSLPLAQGYAAGGVCSLRLTPTDYARMDRTPTMQVGSGCKVH